MKAAAIFSSQPDHAAKVGSMVTVSYTHLHCAFATETYFVYQLVQFMRNVPHEVVAAPHELEQCAGHQSGSRIAAASWATPAPPASWTRWSKSCLLYTS